MKKHRLIALLLVLSMLLFIPTAGAATSAQFESRPDITLAVDGILVSFPDQPPVIDKINYRTLVPVRFPAEALGADVNWKQETQEVFIDQQAKNQLPESHLVLKIGSSGIKVNGENKHMDTTPIVMNNRTLVPIRFISEYLGSEVRWWDKSQTVHIFTKGQSTEEQQKIIDEIANKVKQPEVKPVEQPKIDPAKETVYDAQLEKMAKWLQGRGHEVKVPKYGDINNNYGIINIYSSRTAPNKAQFDADITLQTESYLGKDAAKWVATVLKNCGDPVVDGCNVVKLVNGRYVAVVMSENGEIIVQFCTSF